MSRLFIAVPVTLYDYSDIQSQFDPLLAGRWRDEATLHCTLAFLGDHFTSQEVIRRMNEIALEFVTSDLSGWDYFSGSRVFVLTTVNASLQTLRNQLQTALELPCETLVPHVTLMRVKHLNDLDLFQKKIQSPPLSSLGRLQPKIVLYQSTVLPQGAYYETVQEWLV